MKYPNITFGLVEAVWNKLGGEEGVHKFLNGELIVSQLAHLWHEQNGIIYFAVTSDGTSGLEWIERLEKKGFQIGSRAKSILRSADFRTTSGVTTKIAVLNGMLFEDNNRITKNIHSEANKRKLRKPNAEVVCLIREMFTDEEIKAMGLEWVVVMHEPIKDSSGGPFLLYVDCGDKRRRLSASYGSPDNGWSRGGGFAFAVSQV